MFLLSIQATCAWGFLFGFLRFLRADITSSVISELKILVSFLPKTLDWEGCSQMSSRRVTPAATRAIRTLS